jgi:hypothetical protein
MKGFLVFVKNLFSLVLKRRKYHPASLVSDVATLTKKELAQIASWRMIRGEDSTLMDNINWLNKHGYFDKKGFEKEMSFAIKHHKQFYPKDDV